MARREEVKLDLRKKAPLSFFERPFGRKARGLPGVFASICSVPRRVEAFRDVSIMCYGIAKVGRVSFAPCSRTSSSSRHTTTTIRRRRAAHAHRDRKANGEALRKSRLILALRKCKDGYLRCAKTEVTEQATRPLRDRRGAVLESKKRRTHRKIPGPMRCAWSSCSKLCAFEQWDKHPVSLLSDRSLLTDNSLSADAWEGDCAEDANLALLENRRAKARAVAKEPHLGVHHLLGRR